MTDLSLEVFIQQRFFMKRHAGYSHAEIDNMYPYEFDVEYNMTLSSVENEHYNNNSPME